MPATLAIGLAGRHQIANLPGLISHVIHLGCRAMDAEGMGRVKERKHFSQSFFSLNISQRR
jgi:hypothetical protein